MNWPIGYCYTTYYSLILIYFSFLFHIKKRNACDCEKSFATCLKKVDNKEAKKVLKYHFEIFSGTCIIYDNPYTYSEDS